MVAKIMWWALFAYLIMYGWYYGRDLYRHRHQFEDNTSFKRCGLYGFVFLFFDVLGIGSFAPQTSLFRYSHEMDDRYIPGTLNVGNSIPTMVQALIFIRMVQVDATTLCLMILAAVLGSWWGAKLVARMSEKNIQLSMGMALLITAFFMLASALGWLDLGGEAMGLDGLKLWLGVGVNAVLGALMTVGVGLYSPCMALVSLLGMSPNVAFPIMMGSCAFLMPTCAITFIKENQYNRKAALADTLFGTLGVLIAAFVVKSLPLTVLRWGIVLVVLWTARQMLKAGLRG